MKSSLVVCLLKMKPLRAEGWGESAGGAGSGHRPPRGSGAQTSAKKLLSSEILHVKWHQSEMLLRQGVTPQPRAAAPPPLPGHEFGGWARVWNPGSVLATRARGSGDTRTPPAPGFAPTGVTGWHRPSSGQRSVPSGHQHPDG